MTDGEMLLLSNLLDKKLEPIKLDIKRLQIDNENIIKPSLKLVTENYLAATVLQSSIKQQNNNSHSDH